MSRKSTLTKNSKKIIQLITIIAFCTIFACQYFQTDNIDYQDPKISTPYSRKDYKHWIDADHDCQNTRQEVLISESLEKPILDEKGCKVISGKWFDPYTNQYFTNTRDLDVDHFIPLKEAHQSGGEFWDKTRKMKYANDLDDPESLIAVYKGANRSKGAKDPSDWMPPNEEYTCEYVKTWQRIKKNWGLTMDKKEAEFIKKQSENCQ
jgi:hypothetical protein